MTSNHRIILAFFVLAMTVLAATPTALGQGGSTAQMVAHYKDSKAIVYDRVRGVYGRDYTYDWGTNRYTFFRNYTTTPAPLPTDIDSKTIILDGKLDEDVWKGIDPIVVKLEPQTPWGGAIKNMSVRAINNGTWLFQAFEWDDTTESLGNSPRVKRPEGGFFYNQTHFYSDNLVVGWWLQDGQPTVKPFFHVHYGGLAMGSVPWTDASAKASLWIFKAYLTDDDSPLWPISAFPEKWAWGPNVGQSLVLPYPHMVETLLNTTSNYVMGTGVTHVRACAFPARDTFPWDVRANGKWINGLWTLEVARPLRPGPLNEPIGVTMNFKADLVYHVFFGASDGHHGENDEIGSISQWLTFSIEPPPSPVFPSSLSVVLVAVTIGVVVALVLWRGKGAKQRIAVKKPR